MKVIVGLVFWLASLFTYAQQTAFLSREKNPIDEKLPMEFFWIDDLEKLTEETVAATVKKETQWIHIQFSLDPASTDAEKKEYIKSLRTKLKKLEIIKSNCQVKVVSFDVGEQIFLTEKELKTFGDNWDKQAKANLTNAWKELSPQLVAMFPGTKFYAENWGW